MTSSKIILDATAGTRMMWFDKNHPNAIFLDKDDDDKIRKRLEHYNRLCGSKKRNMWNPKNKTISGTWNNIPFENESFHLIVFDPPHRISLGPKSKFRLLFGELKAETWQNDFKKAFNELFRVLKPYGVLILKWSIADIPLKNLLQIFPIKPLFGQVSTGTKKASSQDIDTFGKKRQHLSFWFCFMKIPKQNVS